MQSRGLPSGYRLWPPGVETYRQGRNAAFQASMMGLPQLLCVQSRRQTNRATDNCGCQICVMPDVAFFQEACGEGMRLGMGMVWWREVFAGDERFHGLLHSSACGCASG